MKNQVLKHFKTKRFVHTRVQNRGTNNHTKEEKKPKAQERLGGEIEGIRTYLREKISQIFHGGAD